MNLRSVLKELRRPEGPVYDYKMLILILVLLAWYVVAYFIRPPGYNDGLYEMGILILIFVFHHLDHIAHVFKWPTWLGVGFRVLSWGWIVFGSFYFGLLLAVRLLEIMRRIIR
jgi:hypothetical protein